MPPSHWVISGFIIFQLLSFIVGSTPTPSALGTPATPHRENITKLGAEVAPVLDRAEGPIRWLDRVVWRATRWIERPIRLYLRGTRQFQRWNMFSHPLRRHEYLHIRYYVASPSNPQLRVHRQLIYPSHTAGIRLFKSFADSFRDKAMMLTLDLYFRRLKREQEKYGEDRAEQEAQVELFPIINPFMRRQSGRILGPGERLVRAELWRGLAPMPGPGETLPQEVYDARQQTISEYDAATDVSYVGNTEADIPPLGAGMTDADIRWKLLAQENWK